MRILGLPGMNAATGPWMEAILSSFSSSRDVCTTQYYQHWQVTDSSLDMEVEITSAAKHQPDLVVAKSLGTLLTLNAVDQGILKPKQCVFIGIPVGNLNEQMLAMLGRWDKHKLPTLFIQQTADVTGSFKQLCSALPISEDLSLAEVDGSDHVYSHIAEVGKIIGQWLSA